MIFQIIASPHIQFDVNHDFLSNFIQVESNIENIDVRFELNLRIFVESKKVSFTIELKSQYEDKYLRSILCTVPSINVN